MLLKLPFFFFFSPLEKKAHIESSGIFSGLCPRQWVSRVFLYTFTLKYSYLLILYVLIFTFCLCQCMLYRSVSGSGHPNHYFFCYPLWHYWEDSMILWLDDACEDISSTFLSIKSVKKQQNILALICIWTISYSSLTHNIPVYPQYTLESVKLDL